MRKVLIGVLVLVYLASRAQQVKTAKAEVVTEQLEELELLSRLPFSVI